MSKLRDYSPKKESVALGILVLLSALTYSQPLFLEDTIDLRLYLNIPWVFWLTLAYGLTLPFLTGWIKNQKAIALWGTIVYVFFWSYFAISDSQLRHPDSYLHSRSALLFSTQGMNTSADSYLLWPVSFVFQDVTRSITGLPLLEASRFLAVILVASIGLVLMGFISAFFKDTRNALLCLYMAFIFPNTLILSTQHYSPQLFAYFLSLLGITLLYRQRTRLTTTNAVMIVTLLGIILSNPTNTAWIFPILVAVWILSFSVNESKAFLLSSFTLLFYVCFSMAWWTQPGGLTVAGDLLRSFWERMEEITARGYSLSEGIFRPSYQPVYSFTIRRLTFLFIGILLVLPLLNLFRLTYRFLIRKAKSLGRTDAFFGAVILGSLVGTLLFWIGSAGAYGDRTWAILIPLLAVFCTKSVSIISYRSKTRFFGVLLTIIVLLLVPLNFVATNYAETLYQTSSREATAVVFVAALHLQKNNIFSDSFGTLGRFSYAILDPSNEIFYEPSHFLNFTVAANSSLLADVRDCYYPYEKWSIFIHSDKARLLMYEQFGKDIGEWKEFNLPQINLFYDNGEIKVYKQQDVPDN